MDEHSLPDAREVIGIDEIEHARFVAQFRSIMDERQREWPTEAFSPLRERDHKAAVAYLIIQVIIGAFDSLSADPLWARKGDIHEKSAPDN